MLPKILSWALSVGLGSVLLLALPMFPSVMTDSSVVRAAELLDLNSASEEQLKALPGIGDKYAFQIIKNRPYKRKDELIQKKLIPQGTYDKIKDQIVSKQK